MGLAMLMTLVHWLRLTIHIEANGICRHDPPDFASGFEEFKKPAVIKAVQILLDLLDSWC